MLSFITIQYSFRNIFFVTTDNKQNFVFGPKTVAKLNCIWKDNTISYQNGTEHRDEK